METECRQSAIGTRYQVLERLVVRVQDGCRQSEAELCRQLQDDVARIAQRHASTPSDAEDLSSDVWELMLRKLRQRQVQNPAAVLAFVSTVARRLAANHRRRRDNQVVNSTELVEAFTEARAPGPDQATETSQSVRFVLEAIEKLPVARDREVLTHVLLLQTPPEEIAAAFGLTREHLPRVVSRAKVRLREALGGDHGTPR